MGAQKKIEDYIGKIVNTYSGIFLGVVNYYDGEIMQIDNNIANGNFMLIYCKKIYDVSGNQIRLIPTEDEY